jgi:hypothetical protein
MAKQLLKTVQGVEVFIDDETGKFSAKIGEKKIEKRLLRDIEKEIEEVSGAVVAYGMDSNYPRSPRRLEISRFEGDRAREKGGSLLGRFEDYYLLDPGNISKIEELAADYRKAKEAFSEYIRDLPRLTARNFDEVRKAQSERDS